MKIKNVFIIVTSIHCFVFADNAINNLHLQQQFNQLYPISSISDQNISFVRIQSDTFLDDHVRTASSNRTLADYVYLTDLEERGGGPFVHDSPGNRRNATFGQSELFSGGFIQTNSTMVMGVFGCPEFQTTVFLTIDPETGEIHYPDVWICNENQVFQGDPPILYRPPVKFPPNGYVLAKESAMNGEGYVFDSTELLNHDFFHRDTLIMTDINFYADSSVHVKRWWFLKPPHLNLSARLDTTEIPFPFPTHLEGVTDPTTNCANPSDLRTCTSYSDSLISYHAKYPNGASGLDEYYLDATISGPHGYSTSEYIPLATDTGIPNPENLLSEEIINPDGPAVLYIQGGPVRVRGIYQGQYTIVTDEYITYRRHAWPNNYTAPIDTLWCNIWITDDLRNAEAPVGNDGPPQPDENCDGGSENRMGLISGANIIVANTLLNGAANSMYGSGVVIHASLVAFNESFTVQYWQNVTNGHFDPPYGDGRGPWVNGFNGYMVNHDYRGTITLWGGITQQYHGYIQRNMPGPYSQTIGYQSNYQYDANNVCSPPPYFPTIQFVGEGNSFVDLGDITQDGVTDVLDLVVMVNIVLENYYPSEIELALGDVVTSGEIDIEDIVLLVSWILGDNLMSSQPLSDAQVVASGGILSINTNGNIAGIQIDYSGTITILDNHLPEGWIFESNAHRMIIFSAEGSTLNSESIFSYSGDIHIQNVKMVDWSGNTINAQINLIPQQYILHPAYPNPFNPVTTFEYGLPSDSQVNLVVYDVLGRQVSELVNNYQTAGLYSVEWNASDLSSGLYFIRMTAGPFQSSQKVMLVK